MGILIAIRFRNLPPSQGGRYAGFGYQRDPIPKSQSQEIFDTTITSLASVSIQLKTILKTIKSNAN